MALTDEELGQALLAKAALTKKTLDQLRTNAKAEHVSLEHVIFERELLSDEKLGGIVAEIYGVPFTKLGDLHITESILRVVPYTVASHQYIIPFDQKGTTLKVAMNNPRNLEMISFLEQKTGLDIEPYYATRKDLKNALKAYNRDVNEKFTKLLKSVMADPSKIESLKDSAKILDTIILFAYQNNASDIHIEPRKNFFVVRYRIDGILHTITELPMQILDLLITRIKVLANLRTDEHRAAQDGRIKIDLEGNEITLRISIIPIYDGEKAVLRLLSSTHQELDLELLGYSPENMKVVRRNIVKTHGMVLMTGPTGSGKTTTLYSILKMLNATEVNISTIEDPIEYRLEGVNQIQVNPKTNLTFANGLRALLRQDPNVIMVGEIRDEETAGIAINAALTGHLVLATLHTNDAATTLPRLLEMGIESFLVAATADLVVAQRLVRTICEKCKKSYTVSLSELKNLGEKFSVRNNFEEIIQNLTGKKPETITFYKGEGCKDCNESGFKGRLCIAELMEVTEQIKKLLLTNASPTEIEHAAQTEGMVPMFIDGIGKVLAGLTTIEEVLRVMRG